jgi:hypothetical protein
MPRRLADYATALLGVILAATPLALWVAWSPAVLFLVLAVAIGSAGLLVLLNQLDGQAAPAASGRVGLPEEFVAEVHELFPLTYHHSHRPAARFRRAMAKLSRLAR